MKKIKNLFILRWYSIALRLIAEIGFVSYILLSIYYILQGDTQSSASIFFSTLGITIIAYCIGLLLLSQIIQWALEIYDKIDLIKRKKLDQEFEENIPDEKFQYQRNLVTVILLLLSLFFVLLFFFTNI